MDIQKILKQRNQQLSNKISQLLSKKDKISRAIIYDTIHKNSDFVKQITNQSLKALGKQPIHKPVKDNSKHKPIDYSKLSKTNPISISHHLSRKEYNHQYALHHDRSSYNHQYYLKHRKHILARNKQRRNKKQSHQVIKEHKNQSHKVTKDKQKPVHKSVQKPVQKPAYDNKYQAHIFKPKGNNIAEVKVLPDKANWVNNPYFG